VVLDEQEEGRPGNPRILQYPVDGIEILNEGKVEDGASVVERMREKKGDANPPRDQSFSLNLSLASLWNRCG